MAIKINFKRYVLFFQGKDDNKNITVDEKKVWNKLYNDINAKINAVIEMNKEAKLDYTFFNGIYKLTTENMRFNDNIRDRLDELTYMSENSQNVVNEYLNIMFRNPTYNVKTDPDKSKTLFYFSKLFIPIFFKWKNNKDNEYDDDIQLFNKLIKEEKHKFTKEFDFEAYFECVKAHIDFDMIRLIKRINLDYARIGKSKFLD